MRYWMWQRRLRLRKRPPRVKRLVRKRRPHLSARERLRDFGLSRVRYLWFVPVLILMIVAVACFRVPRTTTVRIQSAAAQSESASGAVAVRSAKYRTSIPAGYRLAVDLSWQAAEPSPELLVDLILRSGEGSAVAKHTTVIEAGALADHSLVTRTELDIPYSLSGEYRLNVRVSGADGATVTGETELGELTVY